jgi:amino acid transporter
MPNSVVLWIKAGTDYYAMPIFFSLLNVPKREKFTENPGEKIFAYAEKYSFKTDKFKGQPSVNFLNVQVTMLIVMLILVFGNIFMSIMLFIPMFAIFFAMVYFFTGRQELPDEIKFTNLLTVSIYASFPGMMIATVYYGLNLPFVDFQTVCLACFLVYLIVVLNRLKRLRKPDPREEIDDDEDF